MWRQLSATRSILWKMSRLIRERINPQENAEIHFELIQIEKVLTKWWKNNCFSPKSIFCHVTKQLHFHLSFARGSSLSKKVASYIWFRSSSLVPLPRVIFICCSHGCDWMLHFPFTSNVSTLKSSRSWKINMSNTTFAIYFLLLSAFKNGKEHSRVNKAQQVGRRLLSPLCFISCLMSAFRWVHDPRVEL